MKLWPLIKKEFVLELRGKEIFLVLFSLIIMLSSICAAGMSSAFIEPRYVRRIFPILLWIVVACAGVFASMRTHEADLERRAIDSLLLLKVPTSFLFLSKMLVLWLVLFAGFFLSSALLAGLLGVDISSVFLEIQSIGFLLSLGLASLFTLLGAISATSKLKGVLLPILVFPLLFPIFFTGVELLEIILTQSGSFYSSDWFLLGLVADALYVLCGFMLYRFVIRE